MSRGQILLSTAALGIAIAVISVHVVLADHLGLLDTAMRLGGASLLAIAAALITSIATPERPTSSAPARPPLPRR